jgi:1-acyl-sn-glycerol-3-phosphate acyltransferase
MRKALEVFTTTGRYLIENFNSNLVVPEKRMAWANEILKNLNFTVSTRGIISQNKPVIYVSNHIGYIDIPILMSSIEDCVFVSKKEVGSWPILGQASKKIGTVFVKRNSKNSRIQAREEIIHQLTQNNKRIIVFPSGTTSLGHEVHWNKGIFEIAEQYKISVQPVRINYSHLRAAAYIDKDRLLSHLIKLTQHKGLSAHIEFHTAIKIKDVMRDLEYCRAWCSEIFFDSSWNC